MTAALISATVAFVVLIITQWVVFRRERSRLLLGKLEELYMLLFDLEERNLTRFEPVMGLFAGQPIQSPAEVMAVSSKRTDLSVDQVNAWDLLDRVSLLVNFYFPQLTSELDQMFEANCRCIGILQTDSFLAEEYKSGPFVEYEQVRKVSRTFVMRKEDMRQRILTERPVLTKTFTGIFRVRLERLRGVLQKAEEEAVHSRMETD